MMSDHMFHPVFVRHAVNLPLSGLLSALISAAPPSKNGMVEKFQREFAGYLGVKKALAFSSGREAFWAALGLLDLQQGDEVIFPDYTLYAIPALVKACGFKPVFVDVSPGTHNIDVSLLEKKITAKTRVIVATHLFGQPCEIDVIMDIARRRGLKVLEDCAQSCGARYKGKNTGTFGDASFFSFNIGKNLCCCGGGMLVVNSPSLNNRISAARAELAEQSFFKVAFNCAKASVLRFATSKAFFPVTLYPLLRIEAAIGADILDRFMEEKVLPVSSMLADRAFGLSPFQAALGISQLSRLKEINLRMRANGILMDNELRGVHGIKVPEALPESEPIYLYYKIESAKRQKMRRMLLEKGIDTKSDDMFACSTLDIFKDCAGDCPVSARLHKESFEVPCAYYLGGDDIRYISGRIRQVAGLLDAA